MPDLTPIQFATQAYEARSKSTLRERLINMYLEPNPPESKFPYTLHGTPGLKLWATVGDGPIRGMEFMLPKLYVVSGNELYSVSSNGSSTLIGEVKGNGAVRMTNNGTHIAIATTNELYAANDSTIIQLTQSYMNGATYQDGYGIFTQAGTENFWLTDLVDMTAITATEYSTADTFPDQIVGCISDHREVFLAGRRTCEWWYNSGNSDFPFTRSQGGFSEIGCAAGGSIAKAQNFIFWLGNDFAVYQAQGYQPQVISTPAIEKTIGSLTSPHTCNAFTYRQEGHDYYVMSWSDKTLVYDLSTQRWHERESIDANGRWRVQGFAYAWDTNYVGDYSNGKLYEMDLDTYDEDGSTIIRDMISPPITQNDNLIAMDEVMVAFEMGVGLTTGQGSDPEALLSWSDDQGETWSNTKTAKIGAIGKYKDRAIWTRLGAFRERQLRLRVSDPVKVAINGVYARLGRLG